MVESGADFRKRRKQEEKQQRFARSPEYQLGLASAQLAMSLEYMSTQAPGELPELLVDRIDVSESRHVIAPELTLFLTLAERSRLPEARAIMLALHNAIKGEVQHG